MHYFKKTNGQIINLGSGQITKNFKLNFNDKGYDWKRTTSNWKFKI